jgi:hypothetical protein
MDPRAGNATRHPLHAGERIWRESNCYVDLWIGLLNHLGLQPEAMLACAVAPHFEGDQWTFIKPTASEIAMLFGIRVEELTVWRALRDHVADQVAKGRVVLVEVDGFYLPDTHGVTYRLEHNKTTIGIHRFDVSTGSIAYFHNSGDYILSGDDLDGVLGTRVSTAALPPFVEMADVRRRVALDEATLRARSLDAAASRLALTSENNPFLDWADVAAAEVDALAAGGLCLFHAWAFASVRQAGAMTELLAAWCNWISENPEMSNAAAKLRELSQTIAAQQFRLARVPSGGKRPDFADALRRCATLWAEAHAIVVRFVADEMAKRGRESWSTP